MAVLVGERSVSEVVSVAGTTAAPGEWNFAWRAVGLVVAGLAALPWFVWLRSPANGLAGEVTATAAATYAELMWLGILVFALPAFIAARIVSWDSLAPWLARTAERTARIPVGIFAGCAALSAFLLATGFSRFVLAGQPVLIDAMSQLLHARWIAAGQLAGPGSDLGAFVHLQQSLFTEHGWVSQYPPGFVFLLALGFLAGGVWLVGPLLHAAMVFFTVLAADSLLPDRRAEARWGAALVAVSPFVIAQAGAYMSHVAAAAFGALAVWAAARGRAGGSVWGVLAGAAIGALFATRPLTALAVALPVSALLAHRPARMVAFAAGAAPFVVAVGVWNAHFFGAPTTWGYAAALGPSAGPGFGIDPWGNAYGLAQALAYTSAELTALSVFLFETPVPLVALIGVALALSPLRTTGERVILAWALVPLAAHLFYWHHGLFMGPRMLADTAPAWSLLAVMSVGSLVRSVPATVAAWSPRVWVCATVGAALMAGAFWLGPARLMSYRVQPPAALAATATVQGPALVFVHGGWTARIAMRLAAGGMRLDSVETALRQNTTCSVERWVSATERGEVPAAMLDFAPRATALPAAVEISPGNRIRTVAGEKMPHECARQLVADRRGVIEVATLFWRGDLPGMPGQGIVFVRDLGPEHNARLLTRFAQHSAWFLLQRDPGEAPTLLPYAEGEALLWPDTGGAS